MPDRGMVASEVHAVRKRENRRCVVSSRVSENNDVSTRSLSLKALEGGVSLVEGDACHV